MLKQEEIRSVDINIFGILPGMSEVEQHARRAIHARKWLNENPGEVLRRGYPFYDYLYTKEATVAIGWDNWPDNWLLSLE